MQTIKVVGEFGFQAAKDLLKYFAELGFSVDVEILGKRMKLSAEKPLNQGIKRIESMAICPICDLDEDGCVCDVEAV